MSDKARVLVIDDEDPFRELMIRRLNRHGFKASGYKSGEEALKSLAGDDFDVALVDLQLPGMSGIEVIKKFRDGRHGIESIMLTGNGNVKVAVEAMKLGAHHYLEKPTKFDEVKLYITKAFEKSRLQRDNKVLKKVVERSHKYPILIGNSEPMKRLRGLIERMAPNPTSVLIEGETGTGKDVCARLIHHLSPRQNKPCIAINCGALAEGLLENELFGHVKGAYTSAEKDQQGVFELADGGTMFIDEVCEMSLDVQKKFLRVLENGEFRRLGESRVRRADVRIVAATNRNVKQEVAQGRFREDLYFRLNVLALKTPPLRTHKEDIAELVDFFLEKNAGRYPNGARVSPEALALFQKYDWPGNVRELQAIVERGIILSADGVVRGSDCPGLEVEDSSSPAIQATSASSEAGQGVSTEPLTLEALEKGHLLNVLDLCDRNKTRAAKKLGISLRSLYRKLEKHGIT